MSQTGSPIIIYYYNQMSDPLFYNTHLEELFRKTGHTRPLDFRPWDCYGEEPGKDGDLFIYDAVVMSALAEKGYIHQTPDIIDTDDIFDWILERDKVRQKMFAVPVMLCCNSLICRKEDDFPMGSVLDVQEDTAMPLRSMILYYYLQAFCNYQTDTQGAFDSMRHLIRLLGGKEKLEHSRISEFDGVERFSRKECRYFLGFTEHIRLFPKDEYAVHFANFSNQEKDPILLFQADFVSMGNHVHEEKLLDCLDLMEIMTKEDFIYDICTSNGQLQYMLPANRKVYPRLAEMDPLYDILYEQIDNENNCVMRYNARYYEEIEIREEELIRKLLEAPDEESTETV